MSTKSPIELARHAAGVARKAGAKDARVSVSRSRRIEVEWRDGRLDRVRENTKQGLEIALFVDGRYSSNSTSDLRRGALDRYVRDWVTATRFLGSDEHRRLPDPSYYQGLTAADLELRDDTLRKLTPGQRLTTASQLEDAARTGEGAGKIISVCTWAGDTESEKACFCTNGFEATEQGTHASHGLSVSVRGDGDRKPRAWAHASARHLRDLPAPAELGRDARERALSRVGSHQAKTGRYPIVIENRAVGSLTRHLFRPLSGDAVQQKRSFLEDKLGKQVGSPLLDVVDDPHLVRGLSSSVWDGEGMATRKRPVFDGGVPRTFFFDTYYASKQGVEPTTAGTSNLVWKTGGRSAREMVEGLEEGLFVTAFLGGNSNPTTGDFSLGITGHYVKNGKIVHPVSEMNIAGNHLEFWKTLVEAGNDPWRYSSNRVPSLRFDNVQCSGA